MGRFLFNRGFLVLIILAVAGGAALLGADVLNNSEHQAYCVGAGVLALVVLILIPSGPRRA